MSGQAETNQCGDADPTILAASTPSSDHDDQLFEQLTETLQSLAGLIENSDNDSIRETSQDCLSRIQHQVAQVRNAYHKGLEKSESLSYAQADAIVRSAEIIDELEQTKQELAAAKQSAVDSAEATKSLADTIFERTTDAAFVLSGETCIACNDRLLRLLEKSRNEVVGTCPFGLIANAQPDNQTTGNDQFKNACKAALHTGTSEAEFTVLRADETETCCEASLSVFEMGGVENILVVIRDVTTKKALEREMRQHRDFLDNVLNAVSDQIYVRSVSDKLLLVNDAFCDVHHVQRDEILRRSMSDVTPGHARRCLIDGPSRKNSSQYSEQEYKDKSGSVRMFSIRESDFDDPLSGQLVRVSVSRDVTEERSKERRLAKLASVFENATEGIVILSLDGIIEEANPVFAEIAQRPVDELINRPVTAVVDWTFDEFNEALSAAASGSSWTGKICIAHQPMHERTYWVSISRTVVTSGQPSAVVLFSDVTELEQTQRRLKRQALHDNLTLLPNRRYFRERLGSMIESSKRDATSFAVCLLDLDDFKHVNDSLGHEAGDVLLTAVADRLGKITRDDSFLSRFGGDEFAILIPDVDMACRKVAEMTDRIIKALSQPFKIAEMENSIGVSIGVTLFPNHGDDAEVLVRNADVAMYSAKSAGKNQSRIFADAMRIDVESRHRIHNELRQALDGNEISLVYQPKVWGKTGELAGVEILSRWQKPDGQMISPAEFIPVAEQTGLIIPFGDYTLLTACRQAVEWNSQNCAPPHFAINISPQQLLHPGFLRRVESIMQETGAHPEWFEFEITENAVMRDVKTAIRVMSNLTKMGITLAIDDFGTGHSSLSYLKSFSIHTLKIDISFVRDLPDDPAAVAIAQSIISLGKGRGLTVIAEGVETAEQADFLTNENCDVLQGYYIAKPLTSAKFEAWCLSHHATTNGWSNYDSVTIIV